MKHLWSKRFGDGTTQAAGAVSVDASGNVIVTGNFNGAVDFGGGALLSAGNNDIFVAKLGSDGSHLWSKRFGDGDIQEAHAVAVDASGNVIVAGNFYGTVDLGGGALTSAGSDDIYVAKLGPDGAHLWSKRFGDRSSQSARSVAIDASGNVIVTGDFYGVTDFGGGALTSTGGDVYVAKFGSDGTHLWSKRFGDGDYQLANAVALDASGSVIVTGVLNGSVDFGGGVLSSAGHSDIFIAKFGSDGTHLWSKRFGDGDYQGAYAAAVDASGNVIVTGYFYGTVDFGGGALTTAGGAVGVFIAKFGSDGAHLWSKSFSDGSYYMAPHSVAVDASGGVIITGYLYGTVDFGGGALASAGESDIFVAKFGFDGSHLWSKCFGDDATQYGEAVAVDASENVIIAGSFLGTVCFGGSALTSAGESDIFVAKFGR